MDSLRAHPDNRHSSYLNQIRNLLVIQAPLGWLQVTPKGRPRRQTVGPAGNESERILEPHQETTRVLWIVPFSLSDTIEPQNPGFYILRFEIDFQYQSCIDEKLRELFLHTVQLRKSSRM